MTLTSENVPSNPLEVWKQIYSANERVWSSALETTMASPGFAEAQGRFLEAVLGAQKTVRDNTRTLLEAMNMPTREDIARLGSLITDLEEKIDQLDDRFVSVEAKLRNSRPPSTRRPTRAKRSSIR